ncbi:MAG: hypothetical protein CMH48_07810 [Muricauda sp.]|nr:hypothetical protein [Allomuricauda sp.]MBC30738.1 hypothetical protein [Allomuricauda sp.]|tara:strand:- start:166 stop:534 length:369 start_codon:yes stop_codon:yes gene_type:complete
MMQGELFEDSNYIFQVDYYKKGKPTGKRGNLTYANTYSDVLYEFLLKDLCEKVHGHDWWNHVLSDEDIICHKENNVSAFYSVIFKDGNKVLCVYEVEMEVVGCHKNILNNPNVSPIRRVEQL